MYYTYIIRSIEHPDERYIRHTADLRQRLAKHNEGGVPHTSKFKPWRIETYIAFETEEKAIAFESYLKSIQATPLPIAISDFRLKKTGF